MENTIYRKLFRVQQELRAPKNEYNSFGRYAYRSCESILKAAKELLQENELIILLEDRIVEESGRVYIEATAKLVDIETGDAIETVAYAREEDAKKGMDASQLTGATSSYARKYALCGLLAIDDNKDADTNSYKLQRRKKEIELINSMIQEKGIDEKSVLERYGVQQIFDLDDRQREKCIIALERSKKTN